MHNYGEALRYQRDIAGLSLTDLSKQVGTSSQNLGRWERGEVLPNIDFCVKLAEFYNISLNELLGLGGISTMQNVPQLTAEERKLLEDYRELSAPGKQLVKTTVKTLLDGSSAKSTLKKSAN